MPDDIPACAGKWKLFDSTDPLDHAEARLLCLECPLSRQCNDRLERAEAAARPGYGPQGTWAGRFIGGPRSRRRIVVEDRGFTLAEARAARNAWNAGRRNPTTEAGMRWYYRHLKRQRAGG